MNYNDWYFSKYTHIDPSFYAFGEMAWQAAQAAAKKHQCQPVCVFHEGNEIARLQAENVELRKDAERIKRIAQESTIRMQARGFYMPEDYHDLVAAMKGEG